MSATRVPRAGPCLPRKRKTYHHGNLRLALVQASLTLISEHGIGALTLREVARLAGVSHNAPYRHFRDRTAFLAAVAEEGYRLLQEQLLKAREESRGDPVKMMDSTGIIYVQFAVEHPSYFRVMFGPEVADKRDFPALEQRQEATFDMLTDAIRSCQQISGFPRGDPLEYALAAWSVVHGLASILVNGQLNRAFQGMSTEQLARLVTQKLRHG